ncbi:glycosyltransferase family 2 protein [Sunxiuqinia indica]|uniref:glycosyltransferase family 2 protein n=1 Tax=Sunxiuqinia indica TaxID=2692584 RepID=UPI00135BEA9B|nr:glycosyltransferase family 2 protein [Sunxiuqinia indica]
MFSIVIPLYNKSHTIERTLGSVLHQSFKDYEIIIVNDGSTDNSVEVIRGFTSDPRIRIIEQENGGVSVARNKGIKEANYEYIAFLDGDDDWAPLYLETISKAIEMYPESGMISCAGYYKNEVTKNTKRRVAEKYADQIKVINYFENPHVFSHTSATVVTRKLCIDLGGFPEGLNKNEDYVLFFSAALVAPTVYCGFPLSYYYGNVKGQLTTINEKNSYTSEIDVCTRMNITYKLWHKVGRKNKLFKVFLKYELRHIMLTALKARDFKMIDVYLSNLEDGVIKLFPFFEFKSYKHDSFVKMKIFYIYFTKLLWRLHGFPRV